MDYPEDPWNTPDLHRNHNHGPELPKPNGNEVPSPAVVNGNNLYRTSPQASLPRRTTSTFTTSAPPSGPASVAESADTWGFFGATPPSAGGFSEQPPEPTIPFGGSGVPRVPVTDLVPALPTPAPNRTIGGGRAGTAGEETILVTLMPEKEGMFLFRHHNYEVTSSRRGSKVIRRYSDFVWLLECLHKRYPFRALPLLPPKRVAGWSTTSYHS